MLIVFQSPFADARDFITMNTYQLKKPDWLTVNPYLRTDFIHRIGVIEKGNIKKIDWTSADKACRAKKLFSFNTKEIENLSNNNHGMIIHSRRLFPTEIREIGKDKNGTAITYHNRTIGSFEIGFIHANQKKFKGDLLSSKELNNLIYNCINLNITMHLPDKKREKCKLYKVDKYLSDIYLNATTEKSKRDYYSKWWITSGAPMLIVEYSTSEVKDSPDNAKLVKHLKKQNIRLYFADWHINKSNCIKTWYVETNNKTKQSDIKMLLEGLLHINASQQCLNRIIFNYEKINVTKGTIAFEKFNRYLEFTFASLFKRERFGFPCKEFANVLTECEDSVSKEMRYGINAKFTELGIRYNYLRNLDEYIRTIGGKSEMGIDILILTAVKDEFDVIYSLETDWDVKKDKSGYNYYIREMITSSSDKITIGLALALDMGEVNTAILATRLSNELRPKCLAMVGICAGWRKKTRLGDVIVAERVFSYDSGKLVLFEKNEIEEEKLFSDIRTYNLNPVWKQNAQNMTSEWKNLIKTERPIEYEYQELWLLDAIQKFSKGTGLNPMSDKLRKEHCPDWTYVLNQLENKGIVRIGKNIELTDKGETLLEKDRFLYPDGHNTHICSNVHIAPIATGKKVIEDRNAFPKISRNVRSVLGLEMEASAIGAIAELEQIDKFIIVKAVSDYADEDKNDHFRKYSIEASYRYLIAFLDRNYKRN